MVTLVLSKLVTWMRGLPGTSDLRALVYMDEVFGFVPPTAAPPAKKPILTILKQARAFGVGMVLATQNPVDLDYKAMSNAGTWLVGRLQTERDKERVLEGLRSAAGGTDVATLDEAIGGARAAAVPARQRARAGAGRLRDALGDVVPARAADEGADRDADAGRCAVRRRRQPAPRSAGCPAPSAASGRARGRRRRPGPPRRIPPRRGSRRSAATRTARGCARFSPRGSSIRFDDAAAELDTTEEWEALYGPLDNGLDLDSETPVDYDERDFRSDPPAGAVVRRAAAAARRGVVLPRRGERRSSSGSSPARTLDLFRNRPLKLFSRPGETQEQFAARATRRRRRPPTSEAAQDPRPARGEAGPARGRARDSPTPGRGARGRTALAADDRAARRRRQRAQRPARRPRAHAHDRPRRQRDRHGRLAPRHDRPRRRAPAHGRGEGRGEDRRARGARAGDPRRGGRDRRALGRSRRRRSRRSRSGPRRPTSASSSSRSCGFPTA